jgi:hypothetical protein
MQIDKIKITVLEDGTIRSETDEISGANHQVAEEFLTMIARLAGGESERVRRTDVFRHSHEHSGDFEKQH